MPIYVYKNLTTGERFEIKQRITEPPLEEHPETGDPVKRLVQPVGIAFKGSGFYATDSRKSSGTGASATKPDASAKEPASTEGKADGKADAKSDGKTASKDASTSAPKTDKGSPKGSSS